MIASRLLENWSSEKDDRVKVDNNWDGGSGADRCLNLDPWDLNLTGTKLM